MGHVLEGIRVLDFGRYIAKIPAAPLYTPQQALDDPHIRQAGLLVDTDVRSVR